MLQFFMAYPGWSFLIVAAVLAALVNVVESVCIVIRRGR